MKAIFYDVPFEDFVALRKRVKEIGDNHMVHLSYDGSEIRGRLTIIGDKFDSGFEYEMTLKTFVEIYCHLND